MSKRTKLSGCAALATAFSLIVVPATAQFIGSIDLQGHRGARGLYPENTIPAFLNAIDLGVTTLEMDVVITRDRQVLVSHEPWMNKEICLDSTGEVITGNEKRYNIYSMTYSQVAKFDCGSLGNKGFPEQRAMQAYKPKLEEVIRVVEKYVRDFANYEVDYNIEIKSSPDGDSIYHPPPAEYSDIVYQLVEQYLPWSRVVIQSFDIRVLKYWHSRYPHVRLALLVGNLRSPSANLSLLGFNPQIYSPQYRLLSKETVKDLHAKHLRVIPWTVNDKKVMEELAGWNVDGLITDYPNKAAELGLGRQIVPDSTVVTIPLR